MQHQHNYIGGEWVGAQSGAKYSTFNPADTQDMVAEYPRSGAQDALQALDAAQKSYEGWSVMTPIARGRILSKASQILEQRKNELAIALTREEGKTLAESVGEVQRAVDIFRFFGGLSYILGGQTIPHDLPQNLLLTLRQSLGVVTLITPWNFPIAIPAWKMAPALLCGNSVVIKPASQAPGPTLELAKVLEQAGLPKGVLNVVIGEGSAVGAAMCAHPAVMALSFTGSHAVGSSIYQRLAARMVRSQMEMGSKNPTIVLADADLDLAVNLICRAAFGLTGQACTATSRVIVERTVLEPLIEKLVKKTRSIRVGNGLDAGTEMGPAVSKEQLEGNLAYVNQAVRDGAELLTGGNRLSSDAYAHGWFMEPTLLGKVTPNMQIAREEVFGPVVAIMAVDGFDEALAVANGVEMGLSATLVTRDFRKAMIYAEKIEAGVVKINQISTGLALQAPFGGVKKSSTDSFKEQGAGAVEFYSRLKTVYLDYSA